jgi:hypothetical protein
MSDEEIAVLDLPPVEVRVLDELLRPRPAIIRAADRRCDLPCPPGPPDDPDHDHVPEPPEPEGLRVFGRDGVSVNDLAEANVDVA